MIRKSLPFIAIFTAMFFAACSGTASNTTPANNSAAPAKENVTAMGRPDKIVEMMKARGAEDLAQPVLKIVEPKADATITGSTVKVKLELSGDLKGYKPGMNAETHTGNHIHVILDNQPYEAYYNLDQDFELRNVADGPHTLRVFPSRPWHESYKNEGAFQMVKFTVKGGGDPAKPVTTADGNTMSNANAAPTPEGKEMKESKAGTVDPTKPLLTYSRPKGEYKGADGDNVLVDFWVTNTDMGSGEGKKASEAPCPCKVHYYVDGKDMGFIFQWGPIWLNGFFPGKHTVKLELVGRDGKLIDNGGYNSTEREITITK